MPSIAQRVRTLFDDPSLEEQSSINLMLGDLKKILAIDEPGPNFMANMCVLASIEFIARFYAHPLPAEAGLPAAPVSSLSPKQRKKLRERRKDTTAVLQFVGRYFPADYRQVFPNATTMTNAEVMWMAFRHGHVHGYRQKRIRIPTGRIIVGQVSWRGARHLDVFKWGRWRRWVFQVSPRPMFGHLRLAVQHFRSDLLDRSKRDLRARFAVAYDLWREPVEVV